MGAYIIKKEHVKKWVVNNATVTNPYSKELWYACVTLGYDYSESGTSIEKAYNALTEMIYKTPIAMAHLSDIKSFKEIVKN